MNHQSPTSFFLNSLFTNSKIHPHILSFPCFHAELFDPITFETSQFPMLNQVERDNTIFETVLYHTIAELFWHVLSSAGQYHGLSRLKKNDFALCFFTNNTDYSQLVLHWERSLLWREMRAESGQGKWLFGQKLIYVSNLLTRHNSSVQHRENWKT